MRVDLFDFHMPNECIALRPASPRDAARLLVVKDGVTTDAHVRDLVDLIQPGDLMVLNTTKVFPAELSGTRPPRDPRQGGPVSIVFSLHKKQGPNRWAAFARPARRLKAGDVVDFGGGLSADVEQDPVEGEVTLAFNVSDEALLAAFHKVGTPPLPPYISARRETDEQDWQDYQTVFADEEGSVAAPTAGLHFTEDLLAALRKKGVKFAEVTLHVGAGTFLPVKVEDTDDHKMHAEWGCVTREAAEAVALARAGGAKVIAVGTTSLRLLESAALASGAVEPFEGETDIFMTPGFEFKSADMLMTNFHLPKSTLFMLVSAFAGTDEMRRAYGHAISTGYRFYSYGDASLLHLQAN
jgi:S-adenosylmethionine:tRNA ribosyltransferase-isomerase